MELDAAIDDGLPIHLKALNLHANALPAASISEGWQLAQLTDRSRQTLLNGLDVFPWVEEGVDLYLYMWRVAEPPGMDQLAVHVLGGSPVEDAIVPLAILNLEVSEPVTVLAEAWINEGARAYVTDLEAVSAGLSDEDGVIPSQAFRFFLPADMSPHFALVLSELDGRLDVLRESKTAWSRIEVALRQWSLANTEAAGHSHRADEWLSDPLVRLMVTLESLVGERRDEQLSRSIRQRAAILSGPAPDDVLDAQERIKNFYSLRSQYVHGKATALSWSDLMDARAAVGVVVRNWIISMSAWVQAGGNADRFSVALDDALLSPRALDSTITQPIQTFHEAVGPPVS